MVTGWLMKRADAVPLWREMRGHDTFRLFGALTVDELCNSSDVSTEELLRRLRTYLRRPLSRQTLTAWRRGDQAVPHEVDLALAVAANGDIAEAETRMAMRVLADEAANPEFAAVVRLCYGNGQFEMPAAVASIFARAQSA